MIKEIKTENEYKCFIDSKLTLTITKDNDIYTLQNNDTRIIAKVIALDDYRTSIEMIQHKRKTKNGVFRETTKLKKHNASWTIYILEQTGFMRKAKATIKGDLT